MNYEEIVCDANNLYRAYKTSVKSSKWKETTQKFMMNFLRYIFEIQDDIINRTLKNGLTQEFTLHERGRVRPITSIQIRDRIVRHVLCDDILLPEVKKHIIYDNCASIKGRGISQQRKRFEIHLHKYYKLHGNDGWILFGDFSKFYDNIIHEIAKQELLKLFDDYVKYVRQQKFYGRYMDDWYIMNPSKEELEDLLSCIIEIAKEYGIHINRKKTHIVKISSTYKFLQIKYTLTKDGKVIKRINPKRVTTMRRKLKKLSLKVINGEIEYESIENMFRGWMGAHYKLLSKQQRKNLIQLYEELFNKKISVISRKLIVSDASSLAA